MQDHYRLIIKTDQYAGNFEREMTAYCTGCIGDCGVGDEHRDLFQEETGEPGMFDDFILNLPDDHGCSRPCCCNGNDVWILFYNLPTDDMMTLIRERAPLFSYAEAGMSKFRKHYIKILGYELQKVETVVTTLGEFQ